MTFDEIDQAIEAMRSEADLAPLLAPGIPALVFAPDPLRLLWSSPQTNALACAIVATPDGRIDPAFPAARRIEALARSEAPMTGKRFEKIRFETSTLAPLTTCACRRIAMPDGSAALVVSFVDRIPHIRRAASASQPAVPADGEAAMQGTTEPPSQDGAHSPGTPPASDPVPEPEPVSGPVRFLWECDTSGCITRVSGDLASAVGAQNADLVGRSLSAIFDPSDPDALARDPKQIVLDLIARRETFSGRRLFWKARDGAAIAVDFAGFPAPGAAGRQGAYRGFGIARPEISCDWAALAPPPEAAPAAPESLLTREEPVAQIREPDPPSPAATLVPRADGSPASADATESICDDLAGQAGGPVEAASPEPLTVSAALSTGEYMPVGTVTLLAGFATRIGGRLGDSPTPLRIATETDAAATPDDSMPAIAEPLTALHDDDMVGADFADHEEPRHAETEASAGEPDQSVSAAPAPQTSQREPEESPRPAPLSVEERNAFREIAKALGARFAGDEPADASETDAGDFAPAHDESGSPAQESDGRRGGTQAPVIITAANDRAPDIRAVLDRMPAGVVVHRGEQALFVNRYLLDLLGYSDLTAFMEAGGLARLFQARPAALTEAAQEATAPLIIANRNGESVAVEVRLTTVDWLGYPASMLMLRKIAETDPVERLRAVESDLAAREERLREQTAILDTAMDGVIVLDQGGRILSLNRAAEALFGYDQREIAGESLTQLLETESHVSALEYLAAMREDGMRSVLNDGCEVLGRVRQGGAIPLFMTLGAVGEGLERKFCAVLRDMTAFKQTENELIAARRAAEAASAQKSEFLARISHEVRTPLNAIIGFAEVMLQERFGPVGNERYRDYLTDIHASGEHVISLVNDLLDLAKIEAGRMELNFTPVALNDLVNAGVAMMQPEAARERIVLRTSFADRLPPVLVDERAMRQIIINLLSNAVKFTDAGGQVIVSTARGTQGDVVFRVRDTGIGMNEGEVEAALEPFRQLATSRKAGGTGLGLPLTKALVEANQGSLRITSRKDEGTLAEVVFPPARVVAG
ncbi:MAG: PAS domain S-box protein [Salinarimonas sp.]|nr:PAS domain S-box protein [Salinarimonas sp.]